ncbi:MAG: SRPBCC family protein [Actinomycetota bacterium]
MAHVQFELTQDFDAPPQVVWDELVDWKGHEEWIPATWVELHGEGEPATLGAEFTAWSGPFPTTNLGRRLSLQDRMRVDEIEFDAAAGSGSCSVTKLGPTITGTAAFTIEPHSAGSRMVWTEDVSVPIAPQFVAPLLAKIGVAGFRFGMKRLASQLAERDLAAVPADTAA